MVSTTVSMIGSQKEVWVVPPRFSGSGIIVRLAFIKRTPIRHAKRDNVGETCIHQEHALKKERDVPIL
jgi:hypothetical protein